MSISLFENVIGVDVGCAVRRPLTLYGVERGWRRLLRIFCRNPSAERTPRGYSDLIHRAIHGTAKRNCRNPTSLELRRRFDQPALIGFVQQVHAPAPQPMTDSLLSERNQAEIERSAPEASKVVL